MSGPTYRAFISARPDVWANQECYRGDLTIDAPIMGQHGRPVAANNISEPTSRWTLEDLTARYAELLMETARAAWSGMADRISAQK